MHRLFGSLIVGAALIYGGLYTWKHRPQPSLSSAEEQTTDADDKDIPAPQNQPYVKVTGPLADYVASHTPAQGEVEKPRPRYKATAEDHIEDSPVGSSSRIVQKTFSLAHIAQFPFEIPPHAATPRLHGTFRSFVQQVGTFNDDSADVELLLMNDSQYAELSAGRDPGVLFASEASHSQDINFELSPSQSHPVKYHLVFRSAPGGAPRKVVQADFTVNF
jgi:hypothetical protein